MTDSPGQTGWVTPLSYWLFQLFSKKPRQAAWLLAVSLTAIYREAYCRPVTWSIDTVCSSWEEGIKVLVREVHRFWHRLLNSASVWLGAIFMGRRWHATGSAVWVDEDQQASTWVNWPGTYNAIIKREVEKLQKGVTHVHTVHAQSPCALFDVSRACMVTQPPRTPGRRLRFRVVLQSSLA